jgi:hypothetical protein
MRAGWVVQLVEEFQPPRFGTLSGGYCAVLVLLSLMAALRLVLRRRYADALLIAAWAALGLKSVRHIPILAVCAAPAVADLLNGLWSKIPVRRGSWWALVDGIARDHAAGFRRTSLAFPALMGVLWFVPGPWPADFPASRFPVDMANRRAGMLAGARLFTTDYWADYLIFRNYPRQRVFIDGRCDYYGELVTADYMRALAAQPGWPAVMDRAGVNAVLIPSGAPLVAVLEGSGQWRRLEWTRQAVLFTRRE